MAADRKHRKVYTERACMDCGKVMLLHIRCKRCPECQHIADLAADRAAKRREYYGQTRKLGSIDTCVRCGQPYTVAGGMQRYCPSCAESAWAENDRRVSRELARSKLQDPEYRAERNAKRRERLAMQRAAEAQSKSPTEEN